MKARLSRPGSIAYLGTSVTAQREGYRPRLHDRLCRHFPGLRAISAGIGAVGSFGCVFLMDDLVLPHHPDLCLIECTTGDLGSQTPADELTGAVEGIIRKLLSADCAPCLVHLYRHGCSFAPDDSVIAAYEAVADHYGIPSLHVGRALIHQATQGTIDTGPLFKDVVHSTILGGEVMAGMIEEALQGLVRLPFEGAPIIPAGLVAPSNPLHLGRIVPAPKQTPDTSAATALFRGRYPYLDVQSEHAAVFDDSRMDLKGALIVVGPHSGPVKVTTDQHSEVIETWDEWCVYDRLAVIPFGLPQGMQTPVAVSPLASTRTGAAPFLRIIGWLVQPVIGR